MKGRILAGITSNLLFQIMNAIIQLIGIPLCLNYWGENYYGEWLLLFTIPGYFSVADFGLGSSSSAEMSMMEESGKTDEIRKMLRSTFWFVVLWGLLPFGLLILSNYYLPWSSWLNLKVISAAEFKTTFPILVLYIYLSLFLTMPINFYRVIKKYHTERYISAAYKFLEFLVLLVLIIRGFGVVGVALGYLVLRMIYFIYLVLDLTYRTPLFRLFPFEIDFKDMRKIFRPGVASLFIYLGTNIMNQGLNTYIGITMGSGKLVMFNTIRTFVNLIKQVINILNLSIYAEYSYAYGSGSKEKLLKIFRTGMALNILIGGVGCLGLLFIGPPLISWWTNGAVVVDHVFYYLFLFYTFLGTMTAVNFAMLSATNRFKDLGIVFLVLVIFFLAVISFWMPGTGLTNTAVLLICFELVILFLSLRMVLEILEMGWRDIASKFIPNRDDILFK